MPNDNGKSMPRTVLRDVCLVLALLFVGAAAFLLVRLTAKTGAYVRVEVDGAPAVFYPLGEDGEYVLAGGGNTLVIREGEAFVKDCTCPDKLCEKQGKISKVGQSVTCLPNRVHVRVVGDGGVDLAQ